MKLPPRKSFVTHIIVLAIGIIIGSQIPGVITNFRLRQQEKQALMQLEKYPNEANSWLLLSQYRWQRGDKKGSFEAAQKALELDPNYVLAIEKIAFNYINIGDTKKGIEWLEKALKVAEVHAPGEIEMIKFSLAHLKKQMKPEPPRAPDRKKAGSG
jgi:tetratricopeptide (TPR) repeat protein